MESEPDALQTPEAPLVECSPVDSHEISNIITSSTLDTTSEVQQLKDTEDYGNTTSNPVDVEVVVCNTTDVLCDPYTPPLQSPTRKTDVVPSDIKELTIRNLDTGEQFIIGQDDPDFDFDTFELRGGDPEPPTAAGAHTDGDGITSVPRRQSYWQRFVTLFLKGSSTDSKLKQQAGGEVGPSDELQSATTAFKTPFTKLSSFKFRRELGKGAFGRVLLAEARIDGKLYALKIISKKNMRSSDKRQAKAERDILHAMGHRAPHPFTAGLKFAFQSENNLYLGMEYFPGGTLRELIKRFGCLPEVGHHITSHRFVAVLTTVTLLV